MKEFSIRFSLYGKESVRRDVTEDISVCPIQYNVELHAVSITTVTGLTLLIFGLCFALLEKKSTSSPGNALPIIMTKSGRVLWTWGVRFPRFDDKSKTLKGCLKAGSERLL